MGEIVGKGDDPKPGDRMFVFKELEGKDGQPPHTLGFTDARVEPLSFGALDSAKLHQKLTIPLSWRNATVVDTTIEDLDRTKSYTMSATLESPFTSRAIGLVKGGWLPSAFAVMHQDTTILVDRNVVTEIVGRFEGGKKIGREPDFLDLFADEPIRINPLLFVLEGNRRTIPTPDEAEAQLIEVETKLRRALPDAQIVIGPDSLKGALGLIEDSREALARKQQFLRSIAPALIAPVAAARVMERWEAVVGAADLYSVPRHSLAVLAALSAIAVPNGKSPAKRLLKFRNGYTEADAYNALADLRAIEIFIALLGMFPQESIQLCTADKNLALLWVGIAASNFQCNGSAFSYEMAPNEGLFPGDTHGAWKAVLE